MDLCKGNTNTMFYYTITLHLYQYILIVENSSDSLAIIYPLYIGRTAIYCQILIMKEILEKFTYHELPVIAIEILIQLWVVSYKMLADITEFCLHLGC